MRVRVRDMLLKTEELDGAALGLSSSLLEEGDCCDVVVVRCVDDAVVVVEGFSTGRSTGWTAFVEVVVGFASIVGSGFGSGLGEGFGSSFFVVVGAGCCGCC